MVKNLGFRRTVYLLLSGILVCQVLDLGLTLYGIEQLGKFEEANPLIKALMARFGVREGLLLIKGMILLLMLPVLGATLLPVQRHRFVIGGLVAGVAVSLFPVGMWAIALTHYQ